MDGGTQVAIGGQLQQFANIDDKTTGQRSRIDPLPGGNFYLQTLLLILKQEAEEPGVFMRADALVALRLMLTGIADQFDMLVGFIAIQGLKGVIR